MDAVLASKMAEITAADIACMEKGGAHLSCITTPGLVTSYWSPFGGCWRYSLTGLGAEVWREIQSYGSKSKRA